MNQTKLIYITNTRIPSEKANSYQSMQMCNSFAKGFDEVEMWVPNIRNTAEMNKVKKVYDFYNVKKRFNIIRLSAFDHKWLHDLNQFAWANLKGATFALNVLYKLARQKDVSVPIYTRDWYVLKFLLAGRKIGFIKNNIYYEAHKYSNFLIDDMKKINGLIVINNYLYNLHQRNGIKSILVAHDGVNIDEYAQLTNYIHEKKETYSLVYTGNLFQWKGVYVLVDALKYLDKNVELIIVGGSEKEFNSFKEYVIKSRLDNITLIGHVPKRETIKYIEKADILFLPNSAKNKMSLYTSPIKLFEYMASKRPIIASNLASICEVLEDKKNAILCEPDNPKDLADKINWTLENDCTNIVNQAFDDVQEYTWDKRAYNISKFMVK